VDLNLILTNQNLNRKICGRFIYWKYVWDILGYESTFSTINLMKSKYRSSISDKNFSSSFDTYFKYKTLSNYSKRMEELGAGSSRL
jgi:hypothetical protein